MYAYFKSKKMSFDGHYRTFLLLHCPSHWHRLALENPGGGTNPLPGVRTHPCLKACRNSPPVWRWSGPGPDPGRPCSPPPHTLHQAAPGQKSNTIHYSNGACGVLYNPDSFHFFKALCSIVAAASLQEAKSEDTWALYVTEVPPEPHSMLPTSFPRHTFPTGEVCPLQPKVACVQKWWPLMSHRISTRSLGTRLTAPQTQKPGQVEG